MVIEFSLANYRSFYKVQTISFRATGLVSDDKSVDASNIVTFGSDRLLKTVAVYGPNASGKSNLIKGLRVFQRLVNSSLKNEYLAETVVDPFLQAEGSQTEDSFFQMILLLEGRRFRYGFTLSVNGFITNEWLFGPAEKNDTYYFKRTGKEVNANSEWFAEAMSLPYEKLRDNALFLNFCSSFDGPVSRMLRHFISTKVIIETSSRPRLAYSRRTRHLNPTDLMVESGQKEVVLRYMKEAGLAFTDVEVLNIEVDGDIFHRQVLLGKNIYDAKGNIVGTNKLELNENESAGTQKYYTYIGILHQLFEEGGLYVSDEMDANFHPSLLQQLIRIYNNPSINKAGAQLLFTSHDTNLMHPSLMRRDQFYFTEKSEVEYTRLYSLADLKGIRNNADFARQYLAGFYGALPILGHYLAQTDHPDSNNQTN